MTRARIRLLALFLSPLPLLGQVGGISVYDFLNLPVSATNAALGGHHLAVQDDDLSLAARNPALLNQASHGVIALSHGFLPAGISNSYLAYGRHLDGAGLTLQAGLQYTGYGSDLVRRDATGADLGTFTAADFAFIVGASRRVAERLTVGMNLKLVNSQLGDYGSLGILADAAFHYQDTSGRFQFSLLASNFGRQLTTYHESSGREPVPFELQAGLTKELRYLPFRFGITYRYLDRWNVLYDDPEAEDNFIIDLTGEAAAETGAGGLFLDNFSRHFVFSGEFFIGKQRNFRLRAAYNRLRQRELRLRDFRSAAGFSFGFGFRTKRFSLAYGRSVYHLGGGVNQLGIDVRL